MNCEYENGSGRGSLDVILSVWGYCYNGYNGDVDLGCKNWVLLMLSTGSRAIESWVSLMLKVYIDMIFATQR